jgi:hypothetical protein
MLSLLFPLHSYVIPGNLSVTSTGVVFDPRMADPHATFGGCTMRLDSFANSAQANAEHQQASFLTVRLQGILMHNNFVWYDSSGVIAILL